MHRLIHATLIVLLAVLLATYSTAQADPTKPKGKGKNSKKIDKPDTEKKEDSEKKADAEKPAEDAHVRQGYVESSNVSVVEELVGLITVTRLYEANLKSIHVQDEQMKNILQVAMG